MKVESCGREGQVNYGALIKLKLGSRSSGGDRCQRISGAGGALVAKHMWRQSSDEDGALKTEDFWSRSSGDH